jgi:hypothetical protein
VCGQRSTAAGAREGEARRSVRKPVVTVARRPGGGAGAGAGLPVQMVEIAVLSLDDGTATGEVEILDVERERPPLARAAGSLSSRQSVLSRSAVAPAPEPLERGLRQRARAVGRLASARELDVELVEQPAAGGVAQDERIVAAWLHLAGATAPQRSCATALIAAAVDSAPAASSAAFGTASVSR